MYIPKIRFCLVGGPLEPRFLHGRPPASVRFANTRNVKASMTTFQLNTGFSSNKVADPPFLPFLLPAARPHSRKSSLVELT